MESADNKAVRQMLGSINIFPGGYVPGVTELVDNITKRFATD